MNDIILLKGNCDMKKIFILILCLILMSCSKPVENNVLNYSEFKENMTSKFGSDDVVLSCFVIEDKNVMSDEIIIDIYPKEDDYYVYISKDEFVVPNLGKLNEDELLPSIRVLAQDIKISAMTIKKAYDELEKEGYLKSIQGKGTFVAPKNTELAKEQAQKDIEKYIEKIVSISNRFQIDENDVIEMFKIIYGEDK